MIPVELNHAKSETIVKFLEYMNRLGDNQQEEWNNNNEDNDKILISDDFYSLLVMGNLTKYPLVSFALIIVIDSKILF